MSPQSNLEIKQSNPLHLKPWQEIVGIFRDLSIDDYFIYVKIDDNTVIFLGESLESNMPAHKLLSKYVGKRVAILRTDFSDKFLIRVVSE